MFGIKKKSSKPTFRIVLSDMTGTELASCPTGEFALPEEVVLALSVEYFNDPEPCAIHRGAVHKRAMMELMELCPAGESVAVRSLPATVQMYFPAGTAFVRIGE